MCIQLNQQYVAIQAVISVQSAASDNMSADCCYKWQKNLHTSVDVPTHQPRFVKYNPYHTSAILSFSRFPYVYFF